MSKTEQELCVAKWTELDSDRPQAVLGPCPAALLSPLKID